MSKNEKPDLQALAEQFKMVLRLSSSEDSINMLEKLERETFGSNEKEDRIVLDRYVLQISIICLEKLEALTPGLISISTLKKFINAAKEGDAAAVSRLKGMMTKWFNKKNELQAQIEQHASIYSHASNKETVDRYVDFYNRLSEQTTHDDAEEIANLKLKAKEKLLDGKLLGREFLTILKSWNESLTKIGKGVVFDVPRLKKTQRKRAAKQTVVPTAPPPLPPKEKEEEEEEEPSVRHEDESSMIVREEEEEEEEEEKQPPLPKLKLRVSSNNATTTHPCVICGKCEASDFGFQGEYFCSVHFYLKALKPKEKELEEKRDDVLQLCFSGPVIIESDLLEHVLDNFQIEIISKKITGQQPIDKATMDRLCEMLREAEKIINEAEKKLNEATVHSAPASPPLNQEEEEEEEEEPEELPVLAVNSSNKKREREEEEEEVSQKHVKVFNDGMKEALEFAYGQDHHENVKLLLGMILEGQVNQVLKIKKAEPLPPRYWQIIAVDTQTSNVIISPLYPTWEEANAEFQRSMVESPYFRWHIKQVKEITK
jgi:hypothetical protein